MTEVTTNLITFENTYNKWIFKSSLLIVMIMVLFGFFYSLFRGHLSSGLTIFLLIATLIFLGACWYPEFWLRPMYIELDKDHFICRYRYGRKSRAVSPNQVAYILESKLHNDPDNDDFIFYKNGKWFRIKRPIAHALEERYGIKRTTNKKYIKKNDPLFS